MSGVMRIALAEVKGLEVPTNEDLKKKGRSSDKQKSEEKNYGQPEK